MKKFDLFKNFRRKAPAEVVLHCLMSVIFSAVALSYLYIIIWSVIAGAKTHTEIIMNPFGLPKEWHWEHYTEMLDLLQVGGNSFLTMLINSILFSVWPAFATLFITMQFSYCCTKYEFPGSKYVHAIILTVMTLPLYGTSGGMYRLYHNLGLIDSYAQLLVVGSVTTTATLYFMAYFKNLSWSYAEAAMIDGANHFDIYYRVMIPQAKPMFGALFLTTWIGYWNEFESAMIYRPNLPTLAYGIYQFNTEMIFRARLDILFAACVFVLLPALILFVAFNKTITSNVSIGGLKG